MDEDRSPISAEDNDSVIKRASWFFASFFGLGFVPKAPGTAASFVALPLAWFLWFAGGTRALILGVLLGFLLGWLASAIAVRFSEKSDPSFIVIDEVVGQMLVFVLPSLLSPLFFVAQVWVLSLYLVGFLLFRFFDILKPFHVGWVDKNVKGGMGVMLDDIVAGFYASIILCILLFVHYRLGVLTPVVGQ